LVYAAVSVVLIVASSASIAFAQLADLAPDPASADHADGLAVDEERPIGPVIERAGFAIDRRPVEAHCEMQNASDGIFRDWQ